MKTRHKILTAIYICAVMIFSSIPAVPMTAHAQTAGAVESGAMTQEELDELMRYVEILTTAFNATEGTAREKVTAAQAAVHADAMEHYDENSGKWCYDLDAAKEIFALVNAERAAAGIPELVWDDTAYAIAMQRCAEGDIHDSARKGTGENYAIGPIGAAAIHQGWHDSQGHHDNYMSTKYDRGAVAVTDYGIAYEVFFLNGQAYSMELALPSTCDEYGFPFHVTGGFDPVYYAQTYPDVAAVVGTDVEALQNHYLTSGKSEGRFPNALAAYAATVANVTNATNVTNAANGQYGFDPVFYAQTYPDVVAALGTDAEALYNHYITCGITEGRLPNANAANGQ
ncbi:MAG: CAP domain-containing protein [Lachnospiraceae bacterium]|nr:CAP domain-containing protein [Lachnospiraceae bacterium]